MRTTCQVCSAPVEPSAAVNVLCAACLERLIGMAKTWTPAESQEEWDADAPSTIDAVDETRPGVGDLSGVQVREESP